MEVRELRITELKEYENNPRYNEGAVDAVAASIEEFGFKQPIVVDRENVIVAGHTRVKAAKKLGMETVPCIVADDLTPEQIKAFRLADNKVGELAGWDWSKLEEELSELDMDMSSFGFDVSEIEWDDVTELSDESYEEPKKETWRCPNCGHVDSKEHFVKSKGED